MDSEFEFNVNNGVAVLVLNSIQFFVALFSFVVHRFSKFSLTTKNDFDGSSLGWHLLGIIMVVALLRNHQRNRNNMLHFQCFYLNLLWYSYMNTCLMAVGHFVFVLAI